MIKFVAGIGVTLSRTILFLLAGLLILGIGRLVVPSFTLPDSQRLWFFQVIGVNVFFLLIFYLKRKNVNVFQFIRQFWKDFRWLNFLLMFFGFAVLSIGGIIMSSFLIFGNDSGSQNLVISLPLVTTILILVFFPFLQAFVELPFYFVFANYYLEKANIPPLAAGFLIVFFLALQHVVIPISDDIRFIVFRFLSFILLAVFILIAWRYPGNRFGLILAHYIMDLLAVVQILLIPGEA
ncbi:MAG: hypothetical protein IH596_05195 [Bacteroidales bacterium]|nr:hypothetical protein [Bacteroidales bacterium]